MAVAMQLSTCHLDTARRLLLLLHASKWLGSPTRARNESALEVGPYCSEQPHLRSAPWVSSHKPDVPTNSLHVPLTIVFSFKPLSAKSLNTANLIRKPLLRTDHWDEEPRLGQRLATALRYQAFKRYLLDKKDLIIKPEMGVPSGWVRAAASGRV